VCVPQVLLLEHGLGTWDFINRTLDRGAKHHLEKWGCQYNRDIKGIVKRSGLRVERTQRWHFGTTHVYVCRPGQGSDARQ
jgi:methyltransferase OMS1